MSVCLETFPGLNMKSVATDADRECVRCYRDSHIPKLYSSANNMHPGLVPPELQVSVLLFYTCILRSCYMYVSSRMVITSPQGLTQAEEMLISAVMPIMTLYRLPQGQYGYSGHVINLPQDVISFARSLPRLPSELDVIIVRREGADQSHRDFRVRRDVVHRALQWLISNNAYYRANQVHIDQEALAQLPQDGDLSHLVSVALESPSPSDQQNPATDEDDPYDTHLVRSFVPIATQSMTVQEAVRHSVQQRQSDGPPPATSSTLMWPSIGGTPINEFATEGYFSCAFPALFPTGAADFLGHRQNQVTIGNYFKHLMMYEDGRFAKHPRFRYFALNTEMRWRALQSGRIYVQQHPGDAQLSVDELRDMVGREGEAFSNRVLHYASSLRGTKQYWFKQRNRLISMVDTLGLPTIFFTHSAADLQWPELTRLICPEDAESRSGRTTAVIENPAVADWFFSHRIQKFVDAFYVGVLGVTDYWMRFEWQHRGSPHVHGLAWLPDAPDVEQLLSPPNVSTRNPAVLPDGSNVDDAPAPKTNPHVCHKAYSEVEDLHQDLADLVATCQRHTRCSAAYCLRTKNGRQECRFGYPKPLQPSTALMTALMTDEDGPTLLTARNDGMVNSFNPVQLSAWRANVDMQHIVSRRKVIQYCTKYVTKSEPCSQTLREVFTTIVRGLKEGSNSLKAVQKLLINSVGERDYSAQETCHLLLQLPMFRASRDFVVLSLDGSRTVEERLEEEQRATAPSILDHYLVRPTAAAFEHMTLLEFSRTYTMPKTLGSEPTRRSKQVVVIARPYCSPKPTGPKYEQYCRQSLMQHRPFRRDADLLAGCETYAASYAAFLTSGSVPPSLRDDIDRLEQQTQHQSEEDHSQVYTTQTHTSKCRVPRSIPSFNVDGHTLHSLFGLPTKGDFKDLEGERLHRLQQSLSAMRYLIIDEMSMVGRKTLGQVDRRLRQIFPRRSQDAFGGRSCLLFGDFGQLPPVMDLPLYTTDSRTELSDQGRNAYQQFDTAFVLDRIMRQAGQDPQQVQFRDILLRLRDAKVTLADWNHLMTQTPTRVRDLSPFADALHLHPTTEAVVEHNVSQLRASGKPIATIKAVHTGTNAYVSSGPEDCPCTSLNVWALSPSALVLHTPGIPGQYQTVPGSPSMCLDIPEYGIGYSDDTRQSRDIPPCVSTIYPVSW